MKKVLALVLAVMMLSTLAFAVSDEVVDTPNNVKYGGQFAPGASLYVYKGMDSGAVNDWSYVSGDPEFWNAEITSANYTITNQRWTAGKNLLAGLEFDDVNNQLKIKLKEDYTLKQPQILRGSFVLKGKGKGGEGAGHVGVKPQNIAVAIDITVGNWKQEVTIVTDKEVVLDTNGLNAAKLPAGDLIKSPLTAARAVVGPTDEIYNNAVQVFGGANFGDVVINCADNADTEVTFRAYDGDKLFLNNDTGADQDLLKAYADTDADITFLSFEAAPTLNSTATIRFYKDEDSHVYVKKDGKLVSEVKWDEDEDCFVLKTRTLGSYVFSDKALPLNAPTAADTNPDTGANDVVGIATALAAVALVSAAAVSLKK